jgi:NADH dehydrogenase/NADH:ubiquinone oxidoreductase subunit G
VQSEAASLARKVAQLSSEQAETQAELDKTFFLNFGKRGELSDRINALQKEGKAQAKALEQTRKAEAQALERANKAQATADEQLKVAAKLVEEATVKTTELTRAAEAKAKALTADATKQSDALVAKAEQKAKALEKEAAKLVAKASAAVTQFDGVLAGFGYYVQPTAVGAMAALKAEFKSELEDPDAAKKARVTLPAAGHYGTGHHFLPRNATHRRKIEEKFAQIIQSEGQTCLGWRTVPTDNASLGETAKSSEPFIRQVFIGRSEDLATAS